LRGREAVWTPELAGLGPLLRAGPISKTAASGAILLSSLAAPRWCFKALLVILFVSGLQLSLAAPRPRWLAMRVLPLLLSLLAISVLALPLGAEPLSLLDMGARSTACVLSLCALLSSTPFEEVLWAMRRLKVPASAVALVALSVRYLLLVVEEGLRLDKAWRARACGREGLYAALKVFPKLLGSLLLRAVERGERVGMAMLARGFDGEFRTLRRVGEGLWWLISLLALSLLPLGAVVLGWTLWR